MDAPATPRWLKRILASHDPDSVWEPLAHQVLHWSRVTSWKNRNSGKNPDKTAMWFLSITKKNVVHLKHHTFEIYLSLWAWLITPPFEQSLSHICFFRFTSLFFTQPKLPRARRGGANQRDSPRLDPLYDDPIECDSLVAKRQPVQMTNVWSKTSNREAGQNEMNHQAKIACRFERFT